MKTEFPINLSKFKPLVLSVDEESLSNEKRKILEKNIEVCRDAIVFFTAFGGAKGVGGHTGGAYDIVPEFLIADAFIRGSDDVYPVLFDESGHRVAIQYLMAVLNGDLPEEKLLKYREYAEENPLPGHPELGMTDGVKFSSGRLGHLWNFVNGVAKAHPEKSVFVFTSDGAQQEGNDAEAARFAVAYDLNVKIIADDNDVTIAGHPSEYFKGFDLEKTWKGHGLEVSVGDGESIDELYSRMRKSLLKKGPVGLVNKRVMAKGIPGVEGKTKAHDAISAEVAIDYLEKKGYDRAVEMLKTAEDPEKERKEYLGVSDVWEKNRKKFGEIISDILSSLPEEERRKNLVIDSDLKGSTGLNTIEEKHPELFVHGGVMERNNYSVAAGFGFEKGYQGIFATFSAFSEMVNSEVKMAHLNEANVLAHFSHAGVDWMADNSCHFGDNIFFLDNGLVEQHNSMLYFPADSLQMEAVLKKIFHNPGLRFVFSTRSSVPIILDEDGNEYFGGEYEFLPGKDDVIRKGSEGYVVSYGAVLYRALDAVSRLREGGGMDVGLINKSTLNIFDEETMEELADAPFVLVAEDQNKKTGLGIRLGTWLLERGFKGKYGHIGSTRLGHGGIRAQMFHQGLESEDIMKKIKELA